MYPGDWKEQTYECQERQCIIRGKVLDDKDLAVAAKYY
jgi:hypothetical protein